MSNANFLSSYPQGPQLKNKYPLHSHRVLCFWIKVNWGMSKLVWQAHTIISAYQIKNQNHIAAKLCSPYAIITCITLIGFFCVLIIIIIFGLRHPIKSTTRQTWISFVGIYCSLNGLPWSLWNKQDFPVFLSPFITIFTTKRKKQFGKVTTEIKFLKTKFVFLHSFARYN